MTSPGSLCPARAGLLAGALLCLTPGPAPPLQAQATTDQIPVTTASTEARALFEEGREKFENIEFAEAAPLFDQAIAKDAGFALAYAYRALSGGGFTVFRQNLDKAVALADKASEGERHWIMYVKAQADGQSVEQKTHLDRLLAMFPSDKRVHQLAGTYHFFIEGDEKTALRHFEKATALDSTFAAAFNMVGYANFALGQYPAAEKAFKTYISLRPASPNPYDSYAELLMKMGRFDESIAQYRKALEVDANFVASLDGIGDNHVFKGDFARARESYDAQLQKAPNVGAKLSALNNLASSYVHEGDTAGALKALDRVRTLAGQESQIPAVIGAHQNTALVLLHAGKAGEAAAHIAQADEAREAPALPSSVKDGARLQNRLLHAHILARQQKPDEAMAEVAKVKADIEKRQNPYEVRALHATLGVIDLARGNHQGALDHLAQADTDDPYVLFHQAVAHEKKGESDAATKLYRRVAEWNANSFGYALVRAEARAKVKKT